MHEVCIVGKDHLFGIHRPVAVGAEDLSVIVAAVRRPVLRIDEIRSFEGLPLVIFDACATGECRVELISVRMGYHEFIVGHVHAFGK